LDERTRYRWIAAHILPLEDQVRRWLSRRVRSLSQSDADDLIQEAYSRIWSAELGSVQNARAYLYATLRNLLLEQARHAQIVPMERMGEIDDLRVSSTEYEPERRVAARQELQRLWRLLAALPQQCRRTFELRRLKGLSQREAAAEMGISERTVEKHLAKALERILAQIARDEGENEGEGKSEARSNGYQTERD
jgi:RNA polymerase sigma-70 factor (ECF subfamily)